MRDTTERQETIQAGTVKLVGTKTNTIIFWVEKLLENNELYHQMAKANNPYGDGKASIKIKKFCQINIVIQYKLLQFILYKIENKFK